MRIDRQTDMKLIVAFRNFANTPKKAKCRTSNTKTQVRMTYKEYKRIQKKFLPGA
jgi:adenylate cyclase class IV